ncbi:MAG: sugar ABC transporter substrate-binding protein [Clostridiales bacterium]|nr:sugar ABC transporter substrate-binding protein [Clostridiales bacterium]
MKKILALLLALTMMLAMVSCATAETTTAEELAGKKVGFSAISLASEFFADMSDQFDNYFTSAGMNYTAADANMSVETQISNIENFVANGTDYIIMFPVDATAISDAAKSARDDGAFIIVIGTALSDPDAYDVCINVDQYNTGAVQAQMAADWINKTFPDAADASIEVMVMKVTDSEDALARSNGMDEITALCPKAKVVYTTENANVEATASKSQELVEIGLMEHPEIKVIMTYGTDLGQGADEIAMKSGDVSQFAIFTVDTAEYIRDRIKLSPANESAIRGTVMLGEGTPYTCYMLLGEWSDRIVDGKYKEECIAITPETIATYFPEN